MHYVRFTGTREQRTGDWESVTGYEDKAGAVGIVMALRAGLVEIDEATYLSEKAAIEAGNAALPAPPVATDTDLEAIVAVLVKASADVTAAELKDVTLRALRRLRQRGRLT